MKLKTLLISFIALMLAACANFPQTKTGELLVQYATIKFINAADLPSSRALKVIEIARQGKQFFDTDKLPVTEVERLIRQRIDWDNLDEADMILVNALIERVAAEVNTGAVVGEQQRVSGSTVLGWIIEGAELVAR